MAARRCSTHSLYFPNAYDKYKDCPVCIAEGADERKTWVDWEAEPPEDWEQQAIDALRRAKEAVEDHELIPTVKAEVKVRDGQLWVSKWDVFPQAGTLKETDLFRIGQQVFEVIGSNWHRREYLVRPFSMTLSDEDLRRRADG